MKSPTLVQKGCKARKEGRKDNGVEQLILNRNIYKGGASETQSTISILNQGMACIQARLLQQYEVLVSGRLPSRGELLTHMGAKTTPSPG